MKEPARMPRVAKPRPGGCSKKNTLHKFDLWRAK